MQDLATSNIYSVQQPLINLIALTCRPDRGRKVISARTGGTSASKTGPAASNIKRFELDCFACPKGCLCPSSSIITNPNEQESERGTKHTVARQSHLRILTFRSCIQLDQTLGALVTNYNFKKVLNFLMLNLRKFKLTNTFFQGYTEHRFGLPYEFAIFVYFS